MHIIDNYLCTLTYLESTACSSSCQKSGIGIHETLETLSESSLECHVEVEDEVPEISM